MTVTINGTTGIAGTNGSAGTPAVQGEDTNTGIFFPAADTVAVATGGSERLRVDSSGNLGLGVTPSAWDSAGSLEITSDGTRGFFSQTARNAVGANTYYNGSWRYTSTGRSTIYGQVDGSHVWYNSVSGTAGGAISYAQAMTLNYDGDLLVNATSSLGGVRGVITSQGVLATAYAYMAYVPSTASNGQMAFANPNGVVGSITTSGSSTSYATSSDYRLKENVAPMQNALDTVAQLNPVTYTWKADGSAGQGFIAHELQAVVPDCVTGEKDAVDETGNPQYQGVDTSFLVATLVKAIQELTARVAQLEAQ